MFHGVHKPADFTDCTMRSRLGAEFLKLSHRREWGEEKTILINEERGKGKIIHVLLQSIRSRKVPGSKCFVNGEGPQNFVFMSSVVNISRC